MIWLLEILCQAQAYKFEFQIYMLYEWSFKHNKFFFEVAAPLVFVLILSSCALVRPDLETNQGGIFLSK